MSKIIIDTNILVYSINRSSEYHEKSISLLKDSGFELFTTSKNISEFLTVLTKLPHNKLDITTALRLVNEFREIMTIIFPNEKSLKIFEDLLLKYKTAGLKIHDMEIISIALENGIDTIATFNKKDYSNINEVITLDW
jgi:predicted nucleic acid-binding protein